MNFKIFFFLLPCLLKLTDTLTVIANAKKNGRIIATFDWTTMAYQEMPIRFSKDRYLSSCGLLRKSNGQLLVAVAGNKQHSK